MKLSEKHTGGGRPDPAIEREIRARAKAEALPCAVAFEIAKVLGCRPSEVGRTADLMNFSLVKCQLGLFGYAPQKKIVTPRTPQDPSLGDALRSGLVDDRLPCATAWDIAARFGVSKMAVSSACEALGIKIKPCQLGAF